MVTLYKLTDENGFTRNNTKWGENVTHTASGKGPLCTSGWLYAYTDPLLAIMLNPIHADFPNPQLWEAEGKIGISDGSKVGCTKLTTIRRINVPAVTTTQRVKFGILCAIGVYKDQNFTLWAQNWLSGKDRTAAAADAAASAAAASAAAATAASASASAAAYAAADAADASAAAYTAYAADASAAADASTAAYAAYAASAAYAADATAYAAYAAAYAAYATDAANLSRLVKLAMKP